MSYKMTPLPNPKPKKKNPPKPKQVSEIVPQQKPIKMKVTLTKNQVDYYLRKRNLQAVPVPVLDHTTMVKEKLNVLKVPVHKKLRQLKK